MNGFDPDWVKAERVCVIPKSVEEEYFAKEKESHPWPWYIYGREFFAGIGADFREIDGQLQMLLDEVVYEVDEFVPCSMRRAYTVGRRAIDDFDDVPEFSEYALKYKDPDYLGSIAPFVFEMLGRCLYRCQEIEKNLSESFIFYIPERNKPEGETLNDVRKKWQKLTFGQLVKIIKKYWDMVPEIEAGLELFKEYRNLFIHRLCTDARYDISTKWGVMEFLPFLQFFDLQTKIMVGASEMSRAASLSLALHRFGVPEDFDPQLLDDDHNDKASSFFEMFWMKGEPWSKASSDSSDNDP